VRILVFEQILAKSDANVEHLLGVAAVRDRIQDAHSLLLGFGVVVVDFLQAGEELSGLDHSLQVGFVAEVFPAVGHEGFEQIEAHFAGGERVGVVAGQLLAELHEQVEVGFLLEARGVHSVVGVDAVHQVEHD